MENTPKNVRYLQIIGSVLTIIALVLFFFAYKALYGVDIINPISLFYIIGLLVLSILAFINAYSTFQFSSDISDESFDKWQLMQKRFWLAIAIFVMPLLLIILSVLLMLVP